MMHRAWLLVPSSIGIFACIVALSSARLGIDHMLSGVVSCLKWRNAAADNADQDQLLLVHVFHRHGDRTPWFAINELEESKNIWHPTIARHYSPFDDDGKIIGNVHTWGNIVENLKGLSLAYKENNWDSSSPTIFDSSDESSASKLAEMTTWDNHEKPFLGQLTDKGCQQLAAVGDLLRSRYVDDLQYLPSEYDASTTKLQCHSTNMKRTIESADCVLLNLYPPEKRKDGQDIPLHVVIGQTPLQPFNQIWKWCEELKHKAIAHQEKVMSKFDQRFHELLEVVTSHYPTSNEWNVTTHGVAFDQMTCRLSHDIEDRPSMFTQQWLNEFGKYLTRIVTAQMAGDRESLKLTFGKALKHMLDEMESAQNEKSGSGRMILTSCHDDTLLALLCSVYGDNIHASDVAWPDYASWIAFELWREGGSGKRVVKILYNGEPLEIFEGQNCIDLDDLREQWSDVIQ